MRARALLAVGALVAAAFAYACTLTDVTGVPVGVVTIQPPSVTLVEGASVQLSAQVKDRLGGTLPNGAVTWSIENPSLISVSESGLVQALLAGETSVRATIDGVSGSAAVIIQPGPRIEANADDISFFGAVGGPSPDPFVVQITNGGEGTLGGLSASVEYEEGGLSGWLSLSLVGTTAPTNLSVTALSGQLNAGVYNATVHLASQAARNSPISISVQLTVTLDQPVIQLTPTTLEFQVEEGDEAPPAKPVQVTNVGGGPWPTSRLSWPPEAGFRPSSPPPPPRPCCRFNPIPRDSRSAFIRKPFWCGPWPP
jgi:hypothetical protein